MSRHYRVKEYIEYIPTEDERHKYNLCQNIFYGEITEIDFDNGIITIESVTTTGVRDEVISFIRKMTVLEAHNINKMTFQVPPNLQKAYNEQLAAQEKGGTSSVKRENLSMEREKEMITEQDKENLPVNSQKRPIGSSPEKQNDLPDLVIENTNAAPDPIGEAPGDNDGLEEVNEEVGGSFNEVVEPVSEQREDDRSDIGMSEGSPEQNEQNQEVESVQSNKETEKIPPEQNTDPPDEMSDKEESGFSQILKNKRSKEDPKVKPSKGKRKRKHDPDASASTNNVGLRRTARQHKPRGANVRYEYDRDGNCSKQVVAPVLFMTMAQCYEWFGREFPTVKQARTKGIKNYKKFRGDKKMIKIYSSSEDEDSDEEKSDNETSLEEENGEEEKSEEEVVSGDETYLPDKDFTTASESEDTEGFTTADEDITEDLEETRRGKKKKTKETEMSLNDITKLYGKKRGRGRPPKMSLEKQIHKKKITKQSRRSTDTAESDSDNESKSSRKSRHSTSSSAKSQHSGKRRSRTSSSENDKKRDKKPSKSKSKTSKLESKIRIAGKKRRKSQDSSDSERSREKRDRELRTESESDSDKENNHKSRGKSKKNRGDTVSKQHKDKNQRINHSSKTSKNSKSTKDSKSNKGRKKIRSTSDSEEPEENVRKSKHKLYTSKKVSFLESGQSEEENHIRRPLPNIGAPSRHRPAADTPLTTKHATKNHPTAAANASLMRLFSPKVASPASPVDDKQSVLNREIRNLGEHTSNTEDPGSDVYIQLPEPEMSTVNGIFDIHPDCRRGPLDVDGAFMILKLTWGSATLIMHRTPEVSQKMVLNDRVHLEEGLSYTLTSTRGGLINFKCSLPPDESFVAED